MAECLKPLRIIQRSVYENTEIEVPCGRCFNCQKNRYREWSLRLCHELQYHDDACFITLTYRDESLPGTGEDAKRNVQLFLKRLRKSAQKRGIKYFFATEYGTLRGRIHHHAIIYGWKPNEKDDYVAGGRTTNRALEKLWGLGFVSVEPVTPRTCGYVAKYIQKQSVSRVMSKRVGECAPFTQKSQGLGAKWCLLHVKQIVVEGSIKDGKWYHPVPRYYRKLARKYFPNSFPDNLYSQFVLDKHMVIAQSYKEVGIVTQKEIVVAERRRLVALERTVIDKWYYKEYLPQMQKKMLVPDSSMRYQRCIYPENQGYLAKRKL